MKIDLNKLIKDRNLNRAELAKVLFPGNLFPSQALTRLLSGRTSLKAEQIYRLSMFSGLPIESLYADSLQWKMEAKDHLIRFTRDSYSAVFSSATGLTKVYHLDSLLATHILSARNQPLTDYLTEINQIVNEKSVRV